MRSMRAARGVAVAVPCRRRAVGNPGPAQGLNQDELGSADRQLLPLFPKTALFDTQQVGALCRRGPAVGLCVPHERSTQAAPPLPGWTARAVCMQGLRGRVRRATSLAMHG